eukprot:m.446614 g.446614  ORF g.446614 m.446614 type:complete len:486 (+) comp19399_c0_seq1:1437-2894(+)
MQLDQHFNSVNDTHFPFCLRTQTHRHQDKTGQDQTESTPQIMAAAATSREMKVFLFVDDSNLWIEGKKATAQPAVHQAKENIRYRISVNGLVNHTLSQVASHFRDEDVQDIKVGACFLFGSKPPPNDSVWNAAKRRGYEVKVFDKKRMKEKEVDQAIGTKVTKIACKNPGPDTTLVIASGDLDMRPAILEALEEGVNVLSLAFDASVGPELRQLALDPNKYKLSILNDHTDKIGYNSCRSTREFTSFDANAIVVQHNGVMTLKEVENLLFSQSPVFFTTPLDDNCAVLEFPMLRDADQAIALVRRILDLKAEDVIWYKTWECKKLPKNVTTAVYENSGVEIGIKAGAEAEDVAVEIDQDSATSFGDGDASSLDVMGWKVVERRSGQGARHEQRARKKATVCSKGLRCPDTFDCAKQHENSHEVVWEKFKSAGVSVSWPSFKASRCDPTKCGRPGKPCPFFHDEDAMKWCVKCQVDQHVTNDCPYR